MKKVAIICSLDGFANQSRPREIKKFLEKYGHKVIFINTLRIYRLKVHKKAIVDSKYPILSVNNMKLFIIDNFDKYLNKIFPKLRKKLFYYIVINQMKIRESMLKKILNKLTIDFLICETLTDSLILKSKLLIKTLLYCPTPWADELFYGNIIDQGTRKKLLSLEISIYKSANYLSFHWHVYHDYAKKYFYNCKNYIKLDGGCILNRTLAIYNKPAKIAYLGCLDGYWINMKLLSYLSKLYPHIDVYGNPPPHKNLNLNYKGYANPSILSNYQFGLITLSKDRLRREGFSAKHMEYLSYGLPVLVPEWRISTKYLKGSIYYNKNNFKIILNKYSKKSLWDEVSHEAFNQSKDYRWEKVLNPLIRILNQI